MFRLIAFTWNDRDPRQCKEACALAMAVETNHPSCRCVLADEGLRVYFESDALNVARVYSADAGVVLGALFPRDSDGGSASGEPVLDVTVTNAIIETRGRALFERFWGRYIMVIRDRSDGSVLVVADPTGECPLYSTSVNGIVVLFSHLGDITALKVRKFSINWRFVAASMLESAIHSTETGLHDVRRVRAGEVLELLADGAQQQVFRWDLFQLALTNPIEDFGSAAGLARHVIGTCVDRWASCYPRIVLLLSGGIDSSIVLAALLRSQSRPDVTCLHLYDNNIGGDERHFAQLAAAEITAPHGRRPELIERKRTVDGVDLESLSHVPPSVSPRPFLSEALYRREYQREALPRNAALATGFGGDYIFYNTSRARPVVDYVRRHGVRPDLLRLAWDHTGSRTYWSVLWEALGIGLSKRELPRRSTRSSARFLGMNVVGMAGDLESYQAGQWGQSPAFHDACGIPPGKRRHIEAMYVPDQMRDAFDPLSGLQWLSPLLSQPIIELFARIPTYVLKYRGVGRSVARRAFAAELPAQIRRRSWKSVTDNFMHQVFRRHEGFFRDVLVDGLLVKEGLLDRDKVQRHMNEAQDGYVEGATLLIGEYFDLEIWLRSLQTSAAVDHW